MADSDKSPYLVPRNVVTRYQFFPGFGWLEIGAIVGAIIAGALFSVLLGLFTEAAFRFFFIIVFPAVVFFLFKPAPDGQSLIQVVTWLKKWSLRKKRYLFSRRGDFNV